MNVDLMRRTLRHRSGLTLVELLVVLVILAVVTAIAVQSTESVIDQGRYDATQRTLQNIQNAIVGPPNQRAPDGSQLMTGFVADMGRLPILVNATSDPLQELWDQTVVATPAAIAANAPPLYGIQSTTIANTASTGTNLSYPANPPPSGYTAYNNTSNPVTVTAGLSCGWRGPYLQLPIGSSGRLLDGWGKPFDSMSQTQSPLPYSLTNAYALNLTPGAQINIVRSLGAENQADPLTLPSGFSAYNLDQYVPSQVSVPPLAPTASTPLTSLSVSGSLTVWVKSLVTGSGLSGSITYASDPVSVTTSDKVLIVLLTPVAGVLTPVYGVNSAPSTPISYFPLSATAGATTPNVMSTFAGVTNGPRAVQAFQFDSSGNVIKRSPLTSLMVPPGGLPMQTLILQ